MRPRTAPEAAAHAVDAPRGSNVGNIEELVAPRPSVLREGTLLAALREETADWEDAPLASAGFAVET